MIEIHPYTKEFVEGFVYDGMEKNISGPQIQAMVEFYARLGDVLVGAINGNIVCIGGMYPLWNDTAGCFLFLNKEARNYKGSVFKALLTNLNALVSKYKVRTLIVECQSENVEANNLLVHLGFKKNKEFKMAMYLRSK